MTTDHAGMTPAEAWLDRRGARLDLEYAAALTALHDILRRELARLGGTWTPDLLRDRPADDRLRAAYAQAAGCAARRAGFDQYSPYLLRRYRTDDPDATCLHCGAPCATDGIRLCATHLDAWCARCGRRIADREDMCADCRDA